MAVRNIVKIDEAKCNSCGKCAKACIEGAIKMVNGKARLVSDIYCDGLGACIGSCPVDAITIEKREAADFDQEATKKHLAEKDDAQTAFVCPGMAMKNLMDEEQQQTESIGPVQSQLRHWPVQLNLVSPQAWYFKDADLLITADCVPFAMGDFHDKLLKNHSIVIGCPKLDDAQFYIDKLADLIKINKPKSLTVVHMEVPCCFGLAGIVRKALAKCGVNMSFKDITISLKGKIIKTETVAIG